MSALIRILPEQLCNKIAAGEVVERPASVVKELLENSLDAGATEIVVEVEGGGKKRLKVVDDGSGMGREDLFLCLERHATSKIASDDDLFRLQTLGFRGEALPSIASVSRMTLRSRLHSEDSGWEISLEGGLVKRSDACGMAAGTTIEVRDLFYRMPARRKFLRRDDTELGHIGEVVTKLALAHPGVGFRLFHQQRPLIEVRKGESLEERVASLMGRTLLKELQPLGATAANWQVGGLISQPSVTRATTGYIYSFVNGRYIRDRVVQHAILEGYRNLIPRGRYPVVVLFLTISPELVDVNVHPTKHEVRFRQQGEVHDFIVAALHEALRGSDWLRRGAAHSLPDAQSPAVTSDRPEREEAADARRLEIRESLLHYSQRLEQSDLGHVRRPFTDAPSLSLPQNKQVDSDGGYFSGLQIIGQYRNSYLVCQDGDALVLIDQHAADERIGFERLKSQWLAGSIARQELLFPEVIELSHQEVPLMNKRLEQLGRLGFELEPFGGTSFMLKAVPQLLSDAAAKELLRDVAAELAQIGQSGAIDAAIDRVLILMSCHGVVRANQALSQAEMRALLRSLDQVDFNAQCPHGRPVLHRFEHAEVARLFKRG